MPSGFGLAVRRAMRRDAGHNGGDWSVHHVDYVLFKRRLQVFADRRATLRSVIRDNYTRNGYVANDEFASIIHECGTYEEAVAARRESLRKASMGLLANDGKGEGVLGGKEAGDSASHGDDGPAGLVVSVPTNSGDETGSVAVNTSELALKSAASVDSLVQTESQAAQLPTLNPQEVAMHRYESTTDLLSNEQRSVTAGDVIHKSFSSSMAPSNADYVKMTDKPTTGSVKSTMSSFNLHTAGSRVSFNSSKKDTISPRKIWARVERLEREEILCFLADETKKAADFYRTKLATLSQSTNQLKDGFVPDPNGGYYSGESPLVIGGEMLELFAFVTINVVIVRQILIRYDAFVRTFGGTPVSQWYYKNARKEKTEKVSWFWYLLCHVELRDLALDFKEIVRSSHQLEEDADGNFHAGGFSEVGMYKPQALYSDPNADYLTTFTESTDMFKHVLSKTHRSANKAANGHITRRDSFAHTLRDWFLSGGLSDNLGLQPKFLTMRGKSLDREMNIIADWRENKDNPPHQSDAWSVFSENALANMSWKVAFPLGLNLLSICFFMMNYYIVEPSSTSYVNALGCNDAMSGLLIGALPWAMLISMIVYSYWTNSSFRTPILVSGVLLICGNILYGLAYSYGSIYMALAGRFITGLGGTKVINRRYVADTTPLAIRTAVNAAFGMALTFGVALGPATAVRLNRINAQVEIPSIGVVYFNGMTCPGFLMATIWTILTLVYAAKFEEPVREGLMEQKRNEMASKCDAPMIDRTPSQTMLDVTDNTDAEYENESIVSHHSELEKPPTNFCSQVRFAAHHITGALRICMFLFFSKMFTAESLISVTSALTKNRYGWQIEQVGTLGCVNGILTIPLSTLIGAMSQSFQDRVLMTWLVSFGAFGMFLLIDISDLIGTPTESYNEGHFLAVGERRYVLGYLMTFCSLQAFDSVIASNLSKVIPTALASGTLNSGLLTTLVGTLGSACGDVFISTIGFINLRQLMNGLFIPSFCILVYALHLIRKNYDLLAA